MRESSLTPDLVAAPSSGLLILGMHRSGTSAISNLTADLGYRLPADQIPPLPDNTEGFGESRGLAMFNDTVLAALGGSWHSPPDHKQEWRALVREVHKEAHEAFAVAFGPSNAASEHAWVWKDPRLCITLPFWRELLGGGPVRALLVFRDPRSVAASLAAPNRGQERFQSDALGLALWERYNRALLANLRTGDEILAVDVDRLLVDMEYRSVWARHLAGFVAPHVTLTPDAALEAVNSRIKVKMVNARSDEADGSTPEALSTLHRTLKERAGEFMVTTFSSPPESPSTAATLKAHRRCPKDKPCLHRGANPVPSPATTGGAASGDSIVPFTRRDPADRPPAYVVVPVKDRNDLTRRLLSDLHRQGEYAAVYVFDNGSKKKNRKELDEFVKSLGDMRIRVIDAQGWNLHRMWNDGVARAAQHASKKGWKTFDVAVLNNDLHIGEEFLGALSDSLRSHDDLWAVSPNYDRRDLDGIQFVRNIAAGREDGTGGLAGFAFVVRGEAFAVAEPAIGTLGFDEDYQWWFGDSDFAMQVLSADKRLAITSATTVVHVDGGSQTTASNHDMTEVAGTGRRFRAEFQQIIAGDRARFEDKWGAKVSGR